jgi:hypothetical protein
MGHAVHPNYTSKHQDDHKPSMNGGVVIKTNAKQRYATDAVTSFLVKQLIERKGGKVQEFEVRNDMCVEARKAERDKAKLIPGLAAPRSDQCSQKWESKPAMLVAQCCQCTQSARRLARMMCNMPLTCSVHFLKATQSWSVT